MAKQGGLGANFYIGGFDLSGDTNDIKNIRGGPKLWDTTTINQFAHERTGLLRDGDVAWTSFFNPSATGEHAALSGLPNSDVIVTALLPPLAVGSPMASCVSKLVTYETKRPISGELTVDFGVESNAFGVEWGLSLTPGKRTDTAATLGTSHDDTAASTFGAQAYLHVFSFTGTDVTVKLQDSADNSTFADVSGGAFAQITSAPQAQRLALAGTLRQFVRATTVTSGGVTSVTFAVQYSRNPVAVVF